MPVIWLKISEPFSKSLRRPSGDRVLVRDRQSQFTRVGTETLPRLEDLAEHGEHSAVRRGVDSAVLEQRTLVAELRLQNSGQCLAEASDLATFGDPLLRER